MQYIVLIFGIVLSIFVFIMSKKGKFQVSNNIYIQGMVIALAVSLILEVAVFNYQSFQLMGQEAPKQTYEITNVENSGYENVSAVSYVEGETAVYLVEFTNLNIKTKAIDIIPQTYAKVVEGSFEYTDEMFSKIQSADTGFKIVSGIETSQHFEPQLVGKTDTLKLILRTEISNPITSVNIIFNQARHFSLNLFRVLLCLAVVFFLMLIRPKGEGEKLTFSSKSWKQRTAVGVFIIIQLFVVTMFTFGPGFVYDENMNIQDVDIVHNGDDIYETLTKALLQGKVSLNGINRDMASAEQDGISQLIQLENPYDVTQRDNIFYYWDHAYYEGNYYCYFGIVPVLILYLPFYLLTGTFLYSRVVNYIFICLAIMFFVGIVWELAKRWKGKLPFLLVLGISAVMINCSMLLCCIPGGKFYEVAVTSGLFLLFAGIYFLIRARKSKYIKLNIALGALSMALAVGCRPTFLLASIIIIPFILEILLNPRDKDVKKYSKSTIPKKIKKIFSKKNAPILITFLAPYIIIGILLMIYNYVRFGSPLSFGAEYQLTLADVHGYSVTDFGKIPIMLVQALFIIPTFSSVFPYIYSVSGNNNYLGFFYSTSYMGIYSYPFMWITALMPWSLKRGVKDNNLRAFTVSSFIIGIISCYLSISMGGSSLRYSADFGWLLCIAIIPIAFSIYKRASEKRLGGYAFTGLMLLVFVSVIMGVFLLISMTYNDFINSNPYFIYNIEKTLVFWK